MNQTHPFWIFYRQSRPQEFGSELKVDRMEKVTMPEWKRKSQAPAFNVNSTFETIHAEPTLAELAKAAQHTSEIDQYVKVCGH